MNQSGPPAPDGETMVYTVDLGNGQVMDVEGPKGATPEQLQEFVQQNPQGGGEQAAPQEQPMVELQAQQEGDIGFNQAAQPNSKYSPEDEATLKELYRTADAATITQFMASKGFAPTRSMEEWVAARDAAKANGVQIPTDVNYEFPDVAKMQDVPSDLRPGAGMAAARGVIDVIPGVDNITALARAADNQLSDTPDQRGFWAQYDFQRDMTEGAKQGDFRDNPGARIAGSLVGSLAIPTGLEGVGFNAGRNALRAGATVQEARTIAASAVRNRMAAVGGGYGAAHGALGAQDPGQALTGAVTEGAMGAAAGGLMGQVGVARANVGQGAPVASEGQQVLQAAGRLGIDTLPADVSNPTIRRLTAAAAQAPLSASPVIKASARTVEQAQGARDSIAARIGQALDPEAAGEAVKSGAKAYIAQSRTGVNSAYTAAERAAGDSKVAPTKALEVLQRNIAELAETPGGAPALEHLQGLQDSLAQGDVSVAGLRRMRTVLRDQFMKDGLRGSDTERRVGQVLDAAREDVTQGLRDAGKGGAAQLFARADAAHAERVQTIDNVLKPIIGTSEKPKSGEQVIKTLMADLQGNNARAARLLRTLPPEEQATTRASIIGAMGNASAGAQNAEGTAFSLGGFLTQFNKMGETAKRAYFGDETRSALNDLAKVAEGTKNAQAYANRSNTSGGIWGNLGLLAGGTTISPVASTVGLGAQLIGGHLLASPRFARWLARAPKAPEATPAYVERLSRIARAEPAIANEVLQLQQRLVESFSPTRLAANEGSGVGATSQPQEQQYNTQGPQ